MDALVTEKPIDSLEQFCASVISRHRENWPPPETTLAHEFIEAFSPRSLTNTERILGFAKSLGIEASLSCLPEGMHGFNCSNEERTMILLSTEEAIPGSREHTFFHELREILEYRFRDQGCPIATGAALEKRAEQFATYVRMTTHGQEITQLFSGAAEIEQAWKRWLAFAGILAFTVGAGLCCALLPYCEENLRRKQ